MKKAYINGKIYTQDPSDSCADTIITEGKFLKYVGKLDGVKKILESDDTEIIDLKGKVVLPGLIDGHTHPTTVAKTFYRVRMPLTHNKEELLENIRKYAEKYPKEERPYFLCESYFADTFGAEGPKKEMLDEIISDRPARVQDFTDHACWYNSIALEMLKDENGVPTCNASLEKAEFVKDENGEYTGWCLESSPEGDYGIYDAINWRPPEVPDEEMITPLLDYFKAHGIMCLMDGITEGEKAVELFYEMDKAGKLGMFYEGTSYAGSLDDLDNAIENVRKWQEKYGTEHIHINTIKMFVDGTNELGDCYSTEPFCNDESGENYGAPFISEEDLLRVMLRLNKEKIDLHLHVVCDGAFRLILNALEKAKAIEGSKWSIYVTAAHCELIHPDDRMRAVDLGLYIDWSTHWSGGYFGEAAQNYLGMERWKTMYDFTDIIKSGGKVGFSSDVFSYQEAIRANPFFGMQVAMTRVDPVIKLDDKKYPGGVRPPETAKLTLDQLIRGYTVNNAERLRVQDKMGSLEEGKLANFIVLDKDIFSVQPDEVSGVDVEFSCFEGEIRKIKSDLSVERL